MQLSNEIICGFLQESNLIEGYDFPISDYDGYLQGTNRTVNQHVKNSVDAFIYAQAMAMNKLAMSDYRIRKVHQLQMKDLLESRGYYRGINVRVGNSIPPPLEFVPMLMDGWVNLFNKTIGSPEDLHYRFEMIHPFEDGNGRVGRILWAWDLLRRGEPLSIFLDQYKLVKDNSFEEKRSRYYRELEKFSKYNHKTYKF